MKRPAIQLYFGDWLRNAKLRRCTWGARGVLIEVMALMHDSDEYGALRWPLIEIAQAVGCPPPLVRELAFKGVIKGSDTHVEAYRWAPSHSGRRGHEVELVPEQDGPLWYSSRMIRDEYKRTKRGLSTRFGPGGKLPTGAPNPIPDRAPSRGRVTGNGEPDDPPTQREGSGASFAVACNNEGSTNSQGRRARDPVDNPKVNGGDSHPQNVKTLVPPGMTARAAADKARGAKLGLYPYAGEDPDVFHSRVIEGEKAAKKAGHAH